MKASLSTQVSIMKTLMFNSHCIKIQNLDNDIWFSGADIAKAIGYKNGIQAIVKNVFSKYTCEISLRTKGRKPVFISEAGLFELILKSSLLTVAVFQRWVYKQVLLKNPPVEQFIDRQASPVMDAMIEFLLTSATKESLLLIEQEFKVEDIVMVCYGEDYHCKAIVLDFLHIFVYVKSLETSKNSFVVASQLSRIQVNL
jgi:hypothetical protein